MCSVKAPTVQSQSAAEKPPIIVTNPMLDGLDPQTQALRRGRSSLRIEPRTPGSAIRDAAGVRVASATPASLPISPAGIGRSDLGAAKVVVR